MSLTKLLHPMIPRALAAYKKDGDKETLIVNELLGYLEAFAPTIEKRYQRLNEIRRACADLEMPDEMRPPIRMLAATVERLITNTAKIIAAEKVVPIKKDGQ